MITQIILDTTPIQVENFSHTTISDQHNPDILRKVTSHFEVTSDTNQDITTLLYKNDLMLTIPGKNIHFQADISNYSTSITKLYEEDKVGTFHLELVEKTDVRV